MTFDEFVESSGTLSTAKPFAEQTVERLNRRLRGFRAKRFLIQLGGYSLHEGDFNEEFVLDGPHLVIACHGIENVGFVVDGTLFVQKEHRGNGLGPELLAQLFLLGPDVWRRHRHFTDAGLAAYRRAYETLKARNQL